MIRSVPRMALPDVARGRLLLAGVEEEAVIARLVADAEERERRRLERESRASWAPSWRCDECHGFTSSATAACPRCGHVGASNDEGHRSSYRRAHARRRRRRK